MPNGVNIVETIPIMTNYFLLNLAWFTLALYFILGVWSIYKLFKASFDDSISIKETNDFLSSFIKTSVIAVIIMISFLIISCIYKPDYTGKNQYRVEITDSASFNEVYNNYEILEQDGNIYLIKKRN